MFCILEMLTKFVWNNLPQNGNQSLLESLLEESSLLLLWDEVLHDDAELSAPSPAPMASAEWEEFDPPCLAKRQGRDLSFIRLSLDNDLYSTFWKIMVSQFENLQLSQMIILKLCHEISQLASCLWKRNHSTIWLRTLRAKCWAQRYFGKLK